MLLGSKDASGKKKKGRWDGWNNALTYLGMMGKDRTTANKFTANCALGEATLNALYQTNGMARRIVDLVANEMTREWFCIDGDTDNLIISHLETIKAKHKIREMLKWARLYGGAICVMGIDDGQELTEPLNEANIRSVEFLHIYDRHCVQWSETDLYQDPKNAKFNQPEFYTISPMRTGNPFRVHESRTFRFDGESLPDRVAKVNDGWGDSVLTSTWTELSHWGMGNVAINNMMQDFIQTVLKIEGLTDKIGADADDWVREKLSIIDTSRSVANTILLDSLEDFTKHSSTVTGVSELQATNALNLAAVAGIPYSLLMGQSPSGLNATGDTELRLFYDKIGSKQEEILQEPLERLVKLIMLSAEGPFNGVELEDWKIEFEPLWQMDDTQEAAYRKTIADTYAVYIDRNVLDPSEVALSVFGGHKYSSEVLIDPSSREEVAPPTQEETQQYEADKQAAMIAAKASANATK